MLSVKIISDSVLKASINLERENVEECTSDIFMNIDGGFESFKHNLTLCLTVSSADNIIKLF